MLKIVKSLIPRSNSFSLNLAVQKGDLESVSQLIGKGANVNAMNDEGRTVLQSAAGDGYLEIAVS